MAEFQNLAQLRADLTAEDPDERAKAYGAVLKADLDVSEVLGTDPPEKALEKAGVIPEKTSDDYAEAREIRQEQLAVLKEVRDLLKADDSAGSSSSDSQSGTSGGN